MKFVRYEPGQNPNPGPWISIICDADSHAGRLTHVAVFVKSPVGQWEALPMPSVGKEGPRWSLQMLHGNHELTEGERRAVGVGDPMPRRRFDVRCPLCGDSLPVREETLYPVLDTLAQEADAWELELSALRARLIK